MQLRHPRQMSTERLDQRRRQHRDPVLTTLPPPDHDLPPRQIQILDPQRQRLHQPKPRSVSRPASECCAPPADPPPASSGTPAPPPPPARRGDGCRDSGHSAGSSPDMPAQYPVIIGADDTPCGPGQGVGASEGGLQGYQCDTDSPARRRRCNQIAPRPARNRCLPDPTRAVERAGPGSDRLRSDPAGRRSGP